MEVLQNLWNNPDGLHRLSGILQWVSFALIFFGLISGVSKYFVDQQEKYLSKLAQAAKDSAQAEKTQKFEHTVKSLETELSASKEEIAELEKKTVPVNPYRQPIRTASATVEVIIQSSDDINTQFLDRGGYLAFAKGQEVLMVVSATTCFARQIGNNRVLYRGVFELDATSEATQKPILFLKQAKCVQLGFAPMPEKMKVLGGKAICTLNNVVRVELSIPSQQMQKDFIIVPDIRAALSDFKE